MKAGGGFIIFCIVGQSPSCFLLKPPLRICTALVASSEPEGGAVKDENSTTALTERQSTASSAAYMAGIAASSCLVASSICFLASFAMILVSSSCF